MCGGLPGILGAEAMMMAGWRWGAEWTMQKTRVHVYGRGFGTVTDSAVKEQRPPLMAESLHRQGNPYRRHAGYYRE
jgi:hypothetical protein